MGLVSFFFGLIVSVFPAAILLRRTGGRFFVIRNTYLSGALYGFWLWVILMLLLYADLRLDLIGLAGAGGDFGTIAVMTSSLRGFLAGGLLAAVLTEKVLRK